MGTLLADVGTLKSLFASGGVISVWTLVGLAVLTLIKGWPALKKLQLEADGSLRHDLLERVGKLEGELKIERDRCDEQMKELRAIHTAEIAALRAEVATLTQQLIDIKTGKSRR